MSASGSCRPRGSSAATRPGRAAARSRRHRQAWRTSRARRAVPFGVGAPAVADLVWQHSHETVPVGAVDPTRRTRLGQRARAGVGDDLKVLVLRFGVRSAARARAAQPARGAGDNGLSEPADVPATVSRAFLIPTGGGRAADGRARHLLPSWPVTLLAPLTLRPCTPRPAAASQSAQLRSVPDCRASERGTRRPSPAHTNLTFVAPKGASLLFAPVSLQVLDETIGLACQAAMGASGAPATSARPDPAVILASVRCGDVALAPGRRCRRPRGCVTLDNVHLSDGTGGTLPNTYVDLRYSAHCRTSGAGRIHTPTQTRNTESPLGRRSLRRSDPSPAAPRWRARCRFANPAKALVEPHVRARPVRRRSVMQRATRSTRHRRDLAAS